VLQLTESGWLSRQFDIFLERRGESIRNLKFVDVATVGQDAETTCLIRQVRAASTSQSGCVASGREFSRLTWGDGLWQRAEGKGRGQKAGGRRERWERQKAKGKRRLPGCCSRSIGPNSPAFCHTRNPNDTIGMERSVGNTVYGSRREG
jgi:hypothetical protein